MGKAELIDNVTDYILLQTELDDLREKQEKIKLRIGGIHSQMKDIRWSLADKQLSNRSITVKGVTYIVNAEYVRENPVVSFGPITPLE